MVLSTNINLQNSSSISSSDCDDDEYDRWEMVDNVLDNGGDNDGDDDASIAARSAVSSITGECHGTVSDVDDGVVNEKDLDETLELRATLSPVNCTTDESEAENYDDDIIVIIEQLTNMGFSKEQIVKAIRELRNSCGGGATATEIDANAIVNRMLGEEHTTATTESNNNKNDKYQPTHPLQLPIECTLDYLNSTMQELKAQQQELRHRAKNVWSNLVKENDNALPLLLRRRSNSNNINIHPSDTRTDSTAFDGNNEPTSMSHQQNRYGATQSSSSTDTARTSVLESIQRANNKHHLAEKLAAVAVFGSATLLALGHPRAGLCAVAVAGASLAVGEGMVRQEQQNCHRHEEEELHFHPSSSMSTSMRDFGLGRKDVHLD
jgi:hypothetical protein